MMGLPVRELEEDLGINFGSKPAEHSRQDSGKSFELTISPFLSSALGLLPTPKYPVDMQKGATALLISLNGRFYEIFAKQNLVRV